MLGTNLPPRAHVPQPPGPVAAAGNCQALVARQVHGVDVIGVAFHFHELLSARKVPDAQGWVPRAARHDQLFAVVEELDACDAAMVFALAWFLLFAIDAPDAHREIGPAAAGKEFAVRREHHGPDVVDVVAEGTQMFPRRY